MKMADCIRWLWNASEHHRTSIVCRGLMGVLQVAVSLYSIWICKCLIDVATKQAQGDIYYLAALMVGCLVGRLLLGIVNARLAALTEIHIENELRSRLFDRLIGSRWQGREALHSGDILNRIVEDIPAVTDMLCRSIPTMMVTICQLAGALFFLYQLDARLTVVLFLIMPVALLLSKSYIRRMRKLSRNIRHTDSRVQSHIQESLQHRVLIRTLEYTAQATGALQSLQSDLRQKTMRYTDFSLFSRLMVQAGFAAGYAVAFLWGIFGLRDGTVTFGIMTAFLQLVSQIQNPMLELSRKIPAFIRVITSSERLAELDGMPQEEQGTAIRLDGVSGVRIEHLTFSYPGSRRKVLDDFSHDFTPGSLTAVVGETGAGKSTLMRLILALIQPDDGKVTFYNARQEVAASPLTRCNLSYVPQGNTLLSGTIRDNLLTGKPTATNEELRTALHTAAADFVYTLPDGLDTLCGEQGAGLSEGQAQRIAIARGLLRPGGILLLDEPTSSLDNETERILLERLSGSVQDKTLIMITHREAIARLCASTIHIHRNS